MAADERRSHAAPASAYRPRLIDSLLTELLAELPAILVVGPRAAGKTTTLTRRARTVVRLDLESEAAAFRADPDAALRSLPEPVLLDEWHAVPAVLGAVKRAVDRDPRPGRFLIAGSVRADLGPKGWPMVGRVVRVPLYGMTVREQLGRLDAAPLLDRIVAGKTPALPPERLDLLGYVELALRGGYPDVVLQRDSTDRQRWLEEHVEQLLTLDARRAGGMRDAVRLRRYAEAYARNSAGVVDDRSLYAAAGIDRRTALAYERLLRDLVVGESVPAWTTGRLPRLTRAFKRYLVDSSLIAGILRVDATAVLRDGNLLVRLLDTFVASQIRAELAIGETRPRLYHLRQEEARHQIDFVAELGIERLIAIEVRATAAPGPSDAKHLVWLRDRLNDRFVGGVVFHTGPRVFRLSDRITAVPICALWA